MKTNQLFLFLAVLAAGSCRPTPAPMTSAEKDSVVEEAGQTLRRYHVDIRESGLTAEFKYLDRSADFFWVPPGYTSAISYDSVAAVLRQNAPLFKTVDNAWDMLRITPLRHDLASYTGRLCSTMTDTSGKVSTVSLVETGLLIKRPDGWKLLSGQTGVVQ